MTTEEIAALINQLDKEWFIQMKRIYRNEHLYISELDMLIIPSDFKIHINEFPNLENSINQIKEIDFNSYCWGTNYLHLVYKELKIINNNLYSLPIGLFQLKHDIIAAIEKQMAPFTEIIATHKNLKLLYDELSENVNNLKIKFPDPEYGQILDKFLNRLINDISIKYEHITQQITLIETKDHLDFELDQEQLAALLYIINKAEMLHNKVNNDISFLHFCHEYFRFKKKGIYKKPSSFKSFSDKYREYIRGDNNNGLQDIKKMLSPILKYIQ